MCVCERERKKLRGSVQCAFLDANPAFVFLVACAHGQRFPLRWLPVYVWIGFICYFYFFLDSLNAAQVNMREPITKLGIVPIDNIDPTIRDQLAPCIQPFTHLGGGNETPIIFFICRVVKKNRRHFNEDRVCIVTLKHLLIYDERGRQTRAIFIPDIARIVICADGFCLFKVPKEHDLVMRLEQSSYMDFLVNIMKVIKGHFAVGSPLAAASTKDGAAVAVSDKLDVQSHSGSYDQLTGGNKANLTPNPNVAYAENVPLPTILNVDAGRQEFLASLLRLAPPVSRRVTSAQVVSTDATHILRHPLFHPPSTHTNAVGSSAHAAASALLPAGQQQPAATPAQSIYSTTVSTPPPAARPNFASSTAHDSQSVDTTPNDAQRSVVTLRSVATIERDVLSDEDASPASSQAHQGASHHDRSWALSAADALSSDDNNLPRVSAAAPTPPFRPVPLGSRNAPPEMFPATNSDSKISDAAGSRNTPPPPPPPQEAHRQIPFHATEADKPLRITLRERVEAFFKLYDPSKLEHVSSIVIEFVGREDECLRVLHAKYGVALPRQPLDVEEGPNSAQGGHADPVALSLQQRLKSLEQENQALRRGAHYGAAQSGTAHPFPDRRGGGFDALHSLAPYPSHSAHAAERSTAYESLEDFESSIAEYPAPERAILRQHRVDALRKTVRDLMGHNGSDGSSVKSIVQVGLLQDEILALIARQHAEQEVAEPHYRKHIDAGSAKCATDEGFEKRNPDSYDPRFVSNQNHSANPDSASKDYARWYYSEYLPRLMYAQQQQSLQPAAAARDVHLHRR